jgi:hypothetical protein
MLLFANIALSLGAPELVFGSATFYNQANLFYEETDDGEYQVSERITGEVNDLNAQDEGGLGIFDSLLTGLKLLGGVIDLFIRLFFASIFLITILPWTFQLVIGVPLVIAYAWAIVGFIR